MLLSDIDSHLSSGDHKNKTKQLHVWCEDCGKNLSDKTRHFQNELHLQKNQQRNFSQDNGMGSTSAVEKIVNEKKTYNKLKVNPTENFVEQGSELLSKRYFPRFKYQLSYLAKFTKHINGA